MDWIEENKFLAGWIAVTLIGCVLLTINLLKARAEYDEAYSGFAATRDNVHALESKPLYPSEDNVVKKAEVVKIYREAVHGLHTKLASLQRPLRNIEQTDFQSKLKKRIQQMNGDARRLGVELPDGFSLGMPEYVNALPEVNQCPLLDYQLDSIHTLCSLLLSKGISSIEALARLESASGSKKNGSKKNSNEVEEQKIVHRYPIEIVFTTKPDGLREFLNAVSNPVPGAPFHIVRLIRIANSKQLGPLRRVNFRSNEFTPGGEQQDSNDGGFNLLKQQTDESNFSVDDLVGQSEELVVEEEVAEETENAEFILGQEEIEVYVKIELLRLEPPMALETGQPGEGSAERNQGS
jgi:hypothetical protein